MLYFNKKTLLFITIILTLLPYATITSTLDISSALLLSLPTILLQATAVFFVVHSYLQTRSRSLKLFWQFFSLAIIIDLISGVIFAGNYINTPPILQDFFSLFSYFFILLAIETNPHLSETPLNKYIAGRVPALFFTVTCFCYFVLLPEEFSKALDHRLLPSLLFHITISGLIFIRLISCVIFCHEKFWRAIYWPLAIASLALLVDNTNSYFLLQEQALYKDNYTNSLIALIPYCGLIFAASASLNIQRPTKPISKDTFPEFYILLLVSIIFSIHIVGLEVGAHYITNSFWQSFVIGIWGVIAFILVILIAYNKRKNTLEFKENAFTQQQEQKELIQTNHKLLSSILNSEDKAIVRASNNAILTTSTGGEILSSNPAAVQLFQSLEHELKGTNVSALFSAEDTMHYFFGFKSNVYALQRKDIGISVECAARRADGTEFPVQVELQWADREEQPLIVITFINLTSRKLAEKQMLDLKDKFIANISHEFRTPLTIINGILDQYLLKAHSKEEGLELTTAKRNGLRLVRMVEQLLELSRLTDNPKLSLSTYRLSQLMAMPIDSFSRLAKQNDLSFDAEISDDLWLECDAQGFEKIIFNLLANAIKYTPAGGSIKVSAYVDQDNVILEITDTGIGINQASQSKIFERFQRADDEKNHAVFGVGIGLSLVNELVKAHNWRINLVSEYNKGSKFSLSIPLATAVEIETQVPMSVSQSEVSSLLLEQNNNKTKAKNHLHNVVLVIEDNLDMQNHIKRVVEQQHHCLLAMSGEQGLLIAEEYIPDLIVCDIMLTGIDGFEVLKQLKENELTSHIPVILLTARSDLDSRLHGLNLQADEYLSKPFNQQELLIRIENLIENRKLLQQNYLHKFRDHQKEQQKESSVKKVSQLTPSESAILSVDEKFIEKLETIVAKMYLETDLGIQDLASNMAMSERQLQRKMKVTLGTTPNNFIKEFRLAKAQILLQNGSKIGRIALDVGFSSQTYFGRCFKESFNCTPKQYQQQFIKS
ncbi:MULTISPECIES: ATP-binding protein [unclassified Colwellia]|uniref:ATP-binding protein n=1 Tax=unclassified Colwellia TaxID=196834 RepID=UPI0021753E39|nr:MULTISPECIES: ATP-binding protein [unclassified Colwellia]